MHIHVLSADALRRDPAEHGALSAAGRLQIHDNAFWQEFTREEIAVFCVRHAIYCVPTTELIAWIRAEIGERKAIEIGSGSGVVAEALSIPATDNKMQEWASVRAHYACCNQPVIEYGKNVIDLSAERAIATYAPDVVVAAWVTHKYNPAAHAREGNQWGVREEDVIDRTDYIFIGNRSVHMQKPILDVAHTAYEFPWLVSRSLSGAANFIAVWAR